MEYIKKIILNTGEEIEQKEDIKPTENFQKEYKNSKGETNFYIDYHSYQKQFKDFEWKVLKKLNNDIVEQYAVFCFDLIPEDEIEDKDETKDICDFSDEEVSEQYYINLRIQLSLINKNHIDRFMRLVSVANTSEIEDFLSKQELKNKI